MTITVERAVIILDRPVGSVASIRFSATVEARANASAIKDQLIAIVDQMNYKRVVNAEDPSASNAFMLSVDPTTEALAQYVFNQMHDAVEGKKMFDESFATGAASARLLSVTAYEDYAVTCTEASFAVYRVL